jgi:hypothetical protein
LGTKSIGENRVEQKRRERDLERGDIDFGGV